MNEEEVKSDIEAISLLASGINEYAQKEILRLCRDIYLCGLIAGQQQAQTILKDK